MNLQKARHYYSSNYSKLGETADFFSPLLEYIGPFSAIEPFSKIEVSRSVLPDFFMFMTHIYSILSSIVLPKSTGKKPRAITIACNIWDSQEFLSPITQKETIHSFHLGFYLLACGI